MKMVESAIVFPIIILSAMFTVYMTLNYYSECSLRSKLHEDVRDKSAIAVGKTDMELIQAGKPDRFRAEAESIGAKYSSGGGLFDKYMQADASAHYDGGMFTLKKRIERIYSARAYEIDESGTALSASSW
jgi:hypothetical protein